jgi:hypothetical protein
MLKSDEIVAAAKCEAAHHSSRNTESVPQRPRLLIRRESAPYRVKFPMELYDQNQFRQRVLGRAHLRTFSKIDGAAVEENCDPIAVPALFDATIDRQLLKIGQLNGVDLLSLIDQTIRNRRFLLKTTKDYKKTHK